MPFQETIRFHVSPSSVRMAGKFEPALAAARMACKGIAGGSLEVERKKTRKTNFHVFA